MNPTALALVQLARLDRPVGIWLLLWPTLWGLWLAAEGLPDLPRLAVFVAGTVLMRSAGCVFNDLADRKVDGHVQRTAQRPLARGAVGVPVALAWGFALLLGAASLLAFMKPQTLGWALASAGIALAYPFFKRFFAAPQAVLGLAFAMGIPMAWVDTHGQIDPQGVRVVLVLLAASALFTLAYDTLYACADAADDAPLGIRSTALSLGPWLVPAVWAMQALGLALMASFIPWLGAGYAVGWAAAAVGSVFILWQAVGWPRHGRVPNPEAAFQGFLRSHWVLGALWLGMVI